MRAEFVPEWARSLSRVMRLAFWPQRVHPVKPLSKPPLGTRLSAAREEEAASSGMQRSKKRGKCEVRSLSTLRSAATADGKFDTGSGATPETSKRMMRGEWRSERQEQGQNWLDAPRRGSNVNAAGSFSNQ